MEKFSIIGLIGLMISWLLIAPAGAASVPIVNYNFQADAGINSWVSSATYTGQTGWVEDGAWVIGGPNASYRYASLVGQYANGYLGQVVYYPGGAGSVKLSLNTIYSNTATGTTTATIYGSATQPSSGSSWSSTSAFGDLIGAYDFTTSDDDVLWTPSWTVTADNVQAYSWYTLIFYGNLTTTLSTYVRIDEVILEVPSQTPEPASLILLGLGLVGLAGAKRFKKNVFS